MEKIKAFWIAILDFVLFWDVRRTRSPSLMLFQFCQMRVFSLAWIHSFAPKLPNERRKFNVHRRKIEYQTANSPNQNMWEIFSRLLSIEQACVCGLVTMVNSLFSARTAECLLLALVSQPSASMSMNETTASIDGWERKCQQLITVITENFSHKTFHLFFISRKLRIGILLFYFVICECGRLTHTHVHSHVHTHVLQFSIFACGTLWQSCKRAPI